MESRRRHRQQPTPRDAADGTATADGTGNGRRHGKRPDTPDGVTTAGGPVVGAGRPGGRHGPLADQGPEV
ncbi:hypothetical protein [Streptomyces coeruleorubidus]|uniref:hypothetical protein n=1 Tax=Streptomyces coeruleorubidus TaxID=116188 RepID=UPI00123D088E|nr:hypothetical protein [Streptomyces coeruleorubidus]